MLLQHYCLFVSASVVCSKHFDRSHSPDLQVLLCIVCFPPCVAKATEIDICVSEFGVVKQTQLQQMSSLLSSREVNQVRSLLFLSRVYLLLSRTVNSNCLKHFAHFVTLVRTYLQIVRFPCCLSSRCFSILHYHRKAWSHQKAQVLIRLHDLITCQRFELIGIFIHAA